MNYGQGVIDIRETMGLSTDEFANKCGVTAGFIFKIEENCEDITKEEAKDLCEKIGIPLSFYAFLCMERNDAREDRQWFYDLMYPAARNAIINIINNGNKTPDFEPIKTAIKSILDKCANNKN